MEVSVEYAEAWMPGFIAMSTCTALLINTNIKISHQITVIAFSLNIDLKGVTG